MTAMTFTSTSGGSSTQHTKTHSKTQQPSSLCTHICVSSFLVLFITLDWRHRASEPAAHRRNVCCVCPHRVLFTVPCAGSPGGGHAYRPAPTASPPSASGEDFGSSVHSSLRVQFPVAAALRSLRLQIALCTAPRGDCAVVVLDSSVHSSLRVQLPVAAALLRLVSTVRSVYSPVWLLLCGCSCFLTGATEPSPREGLAFVTTTRSVYSPTCSLFCSRSCLHNAATGRPTLDPSPHRPNA